MLEVRSSRLLRINLNCLPNYLVEYGLVAEVNMINSTVLQLLVRTQEKYLCMIIRARTTTVAALSSKMWLCYYHMQFELQ